MKFTLVVLAVALVAKDTSQLNDAYIMRGLAQGLCLAVGGAWLLAHLSEKLLRRYWPVWGYLAALTLSSAWSLSPFYVWLQLVSLAAVLVFFVAYFEARADDEDGGLRLVLNTAMGLYAVAAVLSLVVKFTHPGIAYGAVANGDVGIEYRFRGLFPKAGMLASAAGLTFGLAWFACRNLLLKGVIMAVCAICLALTLSRTMWIALAAGVLAVYLMDRRAAMKWIGLGLTLIVASSVWLGMLAFDFKLDVSNARFLRSESISTLTGRVGLWEEGLRAFYRQPLLGYGYTAGASGLSPATGRSSSDDLGIDSTRGLGRTTLHNGYLQSLLDSGVVGTALYLAIIVVAVWRLYRRSRLTPGDQAVLFGLVFFAIANAAQNVVYSASVFDSIMFFALAIYAMRSQRAAPSSASAVADRGTRARGVGDVRADGRPIRARVRPQPSRPATG